MSMDDKLPASYEAADSPLLPSGVQYAWDSVSLTSILSCPRKYQLAILQGQHPRNPGYAIALVFGILFHTGLEQYHKARFSGADHDQALHHAVLYVLREPATATLPSDEDVEQAREEAKEGADEDDGISLRNSRVRTRYYLIRAIVWYLEHYQDDTARTLTLPSGAPAVEVSFRIALPETVTLSNGHPLVLCGHMDRAVEFGDGFLYVTDYKTTKSITQQWKQMFELSHQMSGYHFGGQVIFDKPTKGVIVDGVALQVGSVKLGRHIVSKTPGQVGEYLKLLKYAASQAEMLAERYGAEDYPMNTAACYFCEFKDICSRPPELRAGYVRMAYEAKPGWNPLANR